MGSGRVEGDSLGDGEVEKREPGLVEVEGPRAVDQREEKMGGGGARVLSWGRRRKCRLWGLATGAGAVEEVKRPLILIGMWKMRARSPPSPASSSPPSGCRPQRIFHTSTKAGRVDLPSLACLLGSAASAFSHLTSFRRHLHPRAAWPEGRLGWAPDLSTSPPHP